MIFEKEILNTEPNWANIKFTQKTLEDIVKVGELPAVVNEYSDDLILVEKLYIDDKKLMAKINTPDSMDDLLGKIDFKLVPKFKFLESTRHDGTSVESTTRRDAISYVSKCEISYLLLVFPFGSK